jgi:hypothetical protein
MILTSDKPDEILVLKPKVWTTVAIGEVPPGSEMHGMLYANVYGTSPWQPGMGIQVDVRALRNGIPKGQPGFDETSLDGRVGIVQLNRTWHARMTQTWFGGDPGDTFHFQLYLNDGAPEASVKGSRYAKLMNN